MKIKVIREASPTARETWEFRFKTDYTGQKFVLDGYGKGYKKSTHPASKWWQDGDTYSRVHGRYGLKLEEVPLPEDVLQEARAKLLERVAETPITT